ncbi:MAG: right-handed parallel beta-helix repeat-containing protein [Gemmatimonadota bacterium]|jgi:hypothetical protein|nr:hypothetical protein [Gemmatimonadota bacterium]MDP7031372.1 right-handed parallel beta-helix repeat-containing protein [Gemmatimonadota bacterium]
MRKAHILICGGLVVLLATGAGAATVFVPADYPTIQQAIDGSVAGDQIIVSPGTYEEQLVLAKDVTVTGSGPGVTVVRSPDTLTEYFTTSANNYPVVYFTGTLNAVVEELTVDGAGKGNANSRFIGVGFYNAGGSLLNCTVTDVRDTPFSGAQHGVGIYAYSDGGGYPTHNVLLSRCRVTDYQKAGIVMNGTQLLGTVTECIVSGAGQTSVTAQNGIQFGYGCSGMVNTCQVRDHSYTGASWTASGILAYQAGNLDVVSCPQIAHNQMGAYFVMTSGTFTDNTLYSGALGQGAGGSYWGLGVDREGAHSPAPAVWTEDLLPPLAGRSTTTVLVNSCSFAGDGTGSGTGIGAWAQNGDNVSLSVDTCDITQWTWGVEVWDDGSAAASVGVHSCCIRSNTSEGVVNYTATDVIATNNWWGSTSGPSGEGPGTGDAVSTGVVFAPWLSYNPCNPVSVEDVSWGRVKGFYR